MWDVQLMASPVVGLAPLVPVPHVVALLRRTSHNGFPVLAPSHKRVSGSSSPKTCDEGEAHGAHGGRRLLGTILRSQLLVMLERGFFCDARGARPGCRFQIHASPLVAAHDHDVESYAR